MSDSDLNLPEILDVLIVGGGPAGTAAAFRAKELDLAALVIDLDDIMRRIRDYTTGKNIYPSFGGGDNLKFPKGGDLVSLLHFSDIDKDDMFTQWKQFYVEHNIPSKVGVELTGINRRDDGVIEAKVWDQDAKKEETLLTKHIMLSIGRGLPRRFDIPGNTMDIAYRLADPKDYIGQPVCVTGGGTSAAEAVIDISNAKIAAKDDTEIYWSYRGDKLPKVSKALADVFFDAYVGNGNIRYIPRSEPVAVVNAEDDKEYLSIRTDRKCIDGRPNETAHLEFSKDYCIACIGEDIPEGLLNSFGIYMANGGPNNKKRMLVSQHLETQQPNVYLVGAILAPAYFVANDFKADPKTFEEVKHRDNIKAGMIDGVHVIEVIAQKLAGKEDIKVELEFVEDKVKPEKAVEEIEKVAIKTMAPVVSDGPPPESIEESRQEVEQQQAFLVRMLAGNVEEDQFPVKMTGTTTIGKTGCDISIPDDSLLSDKHASISHSQEGFYLRDDGSQNGVFFVAPEGKLVEVNSGDLVRVGRQFLLFKEEEGKPIFVHYDQTGKEIQRRVIPSDKTIVLGREAPDVTLDEKDPTLSRRHIAVSFKEKNLYIKDLKSANGTLLKIKDSRKLEQGDRFRVGKQLFVFSMQQDAVIDAGYTTPRALATIPPVAQAAPVPAKPEQAAPAKAEPEKESATPAERMVTFKSLGKSFPLEEGKTICEIAEENGIELVAECHAGICGSDPIKILAGKENLNEMGDEERDAIEDICDLNPDECRLACMAKVSGPVTVDIL